MREDNITKDSNSRGEIGRIGRTVITVIAVVIAAIVQSFLDDYSVLFRALIGVLIAVAILGISFGVARFKANRKS